MDLHRSRQRGGVEAGAARICIGMIGALLGGFLLGPFLDPNATGGFVSQTEFSRSAMLSSVGIAFVLLFIFELTGWIERRKERRDRTRCARR